MRTVFQFAPTSDLRRAAAFYRDTLGLEEAWRDGDDTIAFALPDQLQVMVSTTAQPAGPMYLVTDLAAWIDAHAEVRVVVERYDIPGGAVAGFADADDNVFYVFDQPAA
ncbi:VOC family protein [Agrococcus baldri]|uniref:VOC domain-containing protein n=1 Tax=Agrococcus baldri TaxID=153730 RepID=A0AA87RIX9_9MICO|nr:VOC family protein [Agrococcus baldri]GEK79032.1 hypothetical protein ABA31_03830 [Agrococcus baldri]